MLALGIIVAVAILLVAITSGHSGVGGRGNSRRAFEQADALLLKAEGAMMRGQYDAAYSLYAQVPRLAVQSGCYLFEAEAFYGMARIHEKKGDLPAARQALESALANRKMWADEKPNFERLISNMLDDVNRKLPK